MRVLGLIVALVVASTTFSQEPKPPGKNEETKVYKVDVEKHGQELKLPPAFKKVDVPEGKAQRFRWKSESGETWTLYGFEKERKTLDKVVPAEKDNMEVVCKKNDLALKWLKNEKIEQDSKKGWQLNLVTNPTETPGAKTFYVQRLVEGKDATFMLTYRVPATSKKEEKEVVEAGEVVFKTWKIQLPK